MPQSKGRHAHKHSHHHPPPKASNAEVKSKSNNRVVKIAVLFFTFLGLAIGYFITTDITVLLICTVLGAVAGFLFGYGIKKSLAGK